MLKLADLAASLGTRKIKLGKRDVEIRAVSYAAHARVTTLLSEPEPPFTRQPTSDGHAWMRNMHDPSYVSRCNLVSQQRAAAIAGFALGVPGKDGRTAIPDDAAPGTPTEPGVPDPAAWLKGYAETIMAALPEPVVAFILKEHRLLCAGMEEDAVGKSSSPTPTSSPPAESKGESSPTATA